MCGKVSVILPLMRTGDAYPVKRHPKYSVSLPLMRTGDVSYRQKKNPHPFPIGKKNPHPFLGGDNIFIVI